MLVAVLHFISDDEDPRAIVTTLLSALPPGSYLVASHVSPEHATEGVLALQRTYRAGGVTGQVRTAADFGSVAFTGLELVPPGVVLVSEWRPTGIGPRPPASEVSMYAGVARKPS